MNNKVYKILSINPGSTSTKIGYFENENKIFIDSVFHDSSILMQFASINDQLDYRMEVIEKFLEEKNIDVSSLDAIVGRGGSSCSVVSGVFEISDLLVADTKAFKGHIYHSSSLGVQIVDKLHKKYGGGICLMQNPTVTDEYDDLARVTGVKGVYRHSSNHSLNIKEVARRYSIDINKNLEDLRLIVAHIDGGISMVCFRDGRMVDGIDGGGGDGPFTPTRMGGMAISDFNNFLHDKTFEEIRELMSVKGGFTSYFGTSNSDIIHKMVEEGDSKATRIWNAMIYQCNKTIGALATVLDGNVDAILLTGGLIRFDDLVAGIKKSCGFIAPIVTYPGEFEHEAMTAGALSVLRNEVKPMVYTGVPVFTKFDDED